MQGPPGKQTGEDGLPLPPYAVYNIGGGAPENLHDYISTLLEDLVRAGVLPKDYDFEGHRQLVGMQPGDQSHMRTAPVSREITASHRRSGSARA